MSNEIRRHIDLFSGIGGFAIAAETAWPTIKHTFCDNDPFSQAILKKHWPTAPIFGDIRTLTYAALDDAGRELRAVHQEDAIEERPKEQRKGPARQSGSGNKSSVYLLTGGFPCQPFSQAGRRLGTEDDRHLWPEMLRVIREFHPRWVVGENVGGFVTWSGGLVLEQVHADLEGAGYEVQSFIIPAVALNAPHRRDRVWIVAHQSGEQVGMAGQPRESAPSASQDARSLGQRGRRDGNTRGSGRPLQAQGSDTALHQDATDTEYSGQQKSRQARLGQLQTQGRKRLDDRPEQPSWDENWLEIATRLCTLDDGLPNGLARPRGWRNAALKGAGNAIVPQVAAEIMRAIKAVDY